MSRRRILDASDEEDMADMDVNDFFEPTSSSNGHQHNNPGDSSASSSQHAQLQQRLETQVGVRPSHCWLEQCLRHLRSGGNSNTAGNNDEAIWNQILHADLRDVVRDPESNARNDNDTGAAMQLRNAILQSKNLGNNAANNGNSNGKYQSKKATLPSTFQLLVQMEEVVDVTMNSEQQLAAMGGGGNAAAVANNRNNNSGGNGGGGRQQGMRNPKYRCLKMAFSDGYHSNGKPSNNTNSFNEKENQILYAMETNSIKSLSTSSPPGLKLLLHGPIDIRLGLLQINDGNCTVVGGEIDSWKEVWRKAKEKAQREKGLGVDPTIKALIWNPLMGDEEEADEGEGESGDVTAQPQPPPEPMQQAAAPPPAQPIIASNQQPTAQPNYNVYNNASQNRNQNQSSNANVNASSRATGSGGNLRQNQNQSSSATTNAAPSRATGGGGNLRQRTLDAYPKKPRPETTRLLPGNNASASAAGASRSTAAAQQNASNNPYAQRPSNTNSGRNVQNRAPPIQQQRQPPPPMQNNANVIPIDDSPPPSTTRKSMPQPQQQQKRAQSNPYASLRPTSAPTNNSSTTAARPAAASSATSTTAPSTFTSNPSFSELKKLLVSLRSNRALYKQYYGKIITVPSKIDSTGADKVFNIIKATTPVSIEKKKGKSKKEKKYEFLLVAKFLGPKASDGSIACRVDGSVLQPYFEGYSPAEVRRLSREDKDRANRIVNQSSSQYLHDFSSLKQLQVKFLLTADEFFARMAQADSLPPDSSEWLEDTSNPFLVVVKRN